ncbi:hypothetical protein BH24CHL9_BH24CHL9_06490 [soil metagenome]
MVRIVQGVLAGAALLVTAGGAVALIAPALGPVSTTSAGHSGPLAASLVLAAGAVLVAAGSLAWFGRPDRGLPLIALFAAAAWMARELEGSASVAREARSLGMLITPLFVPLAVHLPIRALGADRAMPIGLMLALLYAAVGITSSGLALTYDPFFDVHCAPVCARGDNLLVLQQDARLASIFETLGLAVSLVGSLGLMAWAFVRLLRPRPAQGLPQRLLIIAAGALGGAMAWWMGALLLPDADLPAAPALLLPAMVTAMAVAAVGAAVTGLIAGEMRRAEAIGRITDAITAGAGSPSLRVTLARTLDDDRLRVAYPLEGGGFIDERGLPMEAPRWVAGRAVTGIERGEALIALVEHGADLDPDVLDREIGAAARLAVDNERLEATVRARLRELQASRTRIVEAGDAARGRLERDLHDGAQQRILAVSFELRLSAAASAQADARAHTKASIAAAIEEVDRALAELRDLAHGIHPVVLIEDGLSGALASLAEEASIPVAVSGDVDRCPGPTELAAYLAVDEAIRRAEVAGAVGILLAAQVEDGWLRLDITGISADDGGSWVRVEDRIGAAGGRLEMARGPSGGAIVRVELPCA